MVVDCVSWKLDGVLRDGLRTKRTGAWRSDCGQSGGRRREVGDVAINHAMSTSRDSGRILAELALWHNSGRAGTLALAPPEESGVPGGPDGKHFPDVPKNLKVKHQKLRLEEQGLRTRTNLGWHSGLCVGRVGKDYSILFDVIGLAAFSHDFKSLDAEESAVANALTALGHSRPSPNVMKILLLAQAFPILALIADLSDAMDEVVAGLTESAKSFESGDGPKSALDVLLNAKELTEAQIRVHAKSILLTGFSTTAASLKVGVELSMHIEKQDRLRAELASFSTVDPSYNELTNALPYLDSVVRETLRLHPALGESTRVACCLSHQGLLVILTIIPSHRRRYHEDCAISLLIHMFMFSARDEKTQSSRRHIFKVPRLQSQINKIVKEPRHAYNSRIVETGILRNRMTADEATKKTSEITTGIANTIRAALRLWSVNGKG
ncbi:cytochrome P450 [Mycena sanguinolenta]|nr:cytochrome P450 [Mycena sanguinolenta]